ncbi:MAG TPA: acyl-CoA carboxylase subunit epsilon [Mycobacterium sp.]
MSEDVVTDEETVADAAPREHEPHIQILRGRPTDEELAALIAVLGSVGSAPAAQVRNERTRWGLAVDRLRFAMSNYQRLTFQQMTHLKQ